MEVPSVIAGEHFGQHDGGNLGWPQSPASQLGESRTLTSKRADATAVEDQRQAPRRREAVRATDPETTPSTQATAAASSSVEIGPSSRSNSAR